MTPTLNDIASAIEEFAPLSLQEKWDNSGWQVRPDGSRECTGVLTCVDVTEEIVAEARQRGCNLIVAHHPLLFHGLKHLCGSSRVERAAMLALLDGVAIYSCHTPLDSCRGGLSWAVAKALNLSNVEVLAPDPRFPEAGFGVVGDTETRLTPETLVAEAKKACNTSTARCSRPSGATGISRVAITTGAGDDFIDNAVAAGAQAYITSDIKHHTFVDRADDIFLVDLSHYSTEQCAKSLLCEVITKKFPNFAACMSETEQSPIVYM